MRCVGKERNDETHQVEAKLERPESRDGDEDDEIRGDALARHLCELGCGGSFCDSCR